MTAYQNGFGMIKLEVLLFLFTHVPFLIYVQNTKYSRSFMAPEVRMEMEGNKELFCLV